MEGLILFEIGSSLRAWDEGSKGRFAPYIQGIIAVIIAKMRIPNALWAMLARNNLPTGVPNIVFQDYLTHGDSVLLANLVHFTRNANRFDPFSIAVVRLLSKFSIDVTLLEVQHDFCVMWNELVQEAQNSGEGSGNITILLLREIWQHYSTLHQDADAPPPEYLNTFGGLSGPLDNPSSYPPCGVHGHRLDPKHYAPNVPIAEAAWLLPPPPAPSSIPPFLRPDFVSPDIAPFSSPSVHPGDTVTQSADKPTIHSMPTPIIQSSYPPPPAMPQPYPNAITPSDSPENMLQATARCPTISSDLDHPTPVTISIYQLTSPPLADRATAAASLDPPMIRMVPLPPSPSLLPSSIAPTSSPPFPMPLLSGSNQAPSGQEILISSSTTAIPPIAHQSSFERDPMATSSAAKDGTPDKSSI